MDKLARGGIFGFVSEHLLLVLALVLPLVGCSTTLDTGKQASQSYSSSTSSQDPTISKDVLCEDSSAIARSPLAANTPSDYLKSENYTLSLETNCGVIEIVVDGKAAPLTTSAIDYLANSGYYDGTLCHRLTTDGIFVLQCGDPQGDGGGNPGFSFADENLPREGEANYPKGTVAMANSGPNTNGSQFFLVYSDTTLGPNYTIWGRITKGMHILEHIAQLGTKDGSPEGEPKTSLEIRKAKLQ